jgi:DNA-directed RNA polymerase specialized sigma24 family protein
MRPTVATFADLLGRTRADDANARKALFDLLSEQEHFRTALRRIVRAVLTPTHPARRLTDSDDLIQSALLRAMLKIGAFRGTTEDKFFCWFRSIVRSRLTRIRRKGARRS